MKKTAICCSLLLLLSACGQKIEPGETPGQAPLVKGLTFTKVSESDLPGSETFVGTVESSARGVLAARIDGQVTKILVQEGDMVKAGQLLLVLGDNPAGDQLRQAQAGLARARREKRPPRRSSPWPKKPMPATGSCSKRKPSPPRRWTR